VKGEKLEGPDGPSEKRLVKTKWWRKQAELRREEGKKPAGRMVGRALDWTRKKQVLGSRGARAGGGWG